MLVTQCYTRPISLFLLRSYGNMTLIEFTLEYHGFILLRLRAYIKSVNVYNYHVRLPGLVNVMCCYDYGCPAISSQMNQMVPYSAQNITKYVFDVRTLSI